MKKTLLFIPVLFIHFFLYAQFAPVGSKWNFSNYSTDLPSYNQKYFAEKDTIVAGRIYTKISSDKPWEQPVYRSNDSGLVYYYMKGQRLLLFNFNAIEGDTLLVDYCPFNGDSVAQQYPILIQSVTYIHDIKHDSVKQFAIYDMQTMKLAKITERFLYESNMSGLLSNDIFETPGPGHGKSFVCYRETGPSGFTFITTDTAVCDVVGINEQNKYDRDLILYPNPAKSTLTITLSDLQSFGNAHATLYDMKGDAVRNKNISGSVTDFYTDNLKPGAYFLVIDWPEGIRSVRKIMIE